MENGKRIKQTNIANLDGLTFEYVLFGDAGPIIVLECGLGDTLKVWQPVIEMSSIPARFFLYNRAGYGKSKSSNGTRDGQHIAKELHALLHKLHLSPPYILVGHSLGCTYIQIFAGLYRDEVGGLIMIDPMTIEMDELCQNNNIKEWEPSRFKKFILSIFLSQGTKRELKQRDVSLLQAKQSEFFSKDIFFAIVTADGGMWSIPLQRQWLRSHELLRERLSGCTHIIAENTGHHIQQERPDLITELLEKIVRISTVNKALPRTGG